MAPYKLRGEIGSVDWILTHYWELKDGQLPLEIIGKGGRSHRSPQETALIWVSDIDFGINALNRRDPELWKDLCMDLNEKKLGLVFGRLNRSQQNLARWYFLPPEDGEDEKSPSRIDAYWRAFKAAKKIRRILNEREER